MASRYEAVTEAGDGSWERVRIVHRSSRSRRRSSQRCELRWSGCALRWPRCERESNKTRAIRIDRLPQKLLHQRERLRRIAAGASVEGSRDTPEHIERWRSPLEWTDWLTWFRSAAGVVAPLSEVRTPSRSAISNGTFLRFGQS